MAGAEESANKSEQQIPSPKECRFSQWKENHIFRGERNLCSPPESLFKTINLDNLELLLERTRKKQT